VLRFSIFPAGFLSFRAGPDRCAVDVSSRGLLKLGGGTFTRMVSPLAACIEDLKDPRNRVLDYLGPLAAFLPGMTRSRRRSSFRPRLELFEADHAEPLRARLGAPGRRAALRNPTDPTHRATVPARCAIIVTSLSSFRNRSKIRDLTGRGPFRARPAAAEYIHSPRSTLQMATADCRCSWGLGRSMKPRFLREGVRVAIGTDQPYYF
jgi:hypothetical protein